MRENPGQNHPLLPYFFQNFILGTAVSGEGEECHFRLFADQRTSAYLLSEMRLQKMMGEVFEKITRAAGMEMPMPV